MRLFCIMEPQEWMIPFSTPSLGFIRPESRLFFSGSCFGEAMYEAAHHSGFQSFYGPCGIVFNPLAMAEGFQRMLEARAYHQSDMLYDGSLWHSFDHHSSFSGTDARQVLDGINLHMSAAREALMQTDILVLSFGTAWHYRLMESGRIVSNNHRQPAAAFIKEFADAGRISSVWERLIQDSRRVNPRLKVCLAVSPVKYLRDGLVQHNQSKASLISAVHSLCSQLPDVHYFPSYELLVDVLRDYRWYAADMAHPSAQAVSMIWREFSAAWMNEAARHMMQELGRYKLLADHKTRFPDTQAAKNLEVRKATLQQQLIDAYPHLNGTRGWR